MQTRITPNRLLLHFFCFLIIESKVPDQPLSKLSPFVIEKVLVGLAGSPKSVKKKQPDGGRIRRLPSCRVVKPHQWTRLFAVGGDS